MLKPERDRKRNYSFGPPKYNSNSQILSVMRYTEGISLVGSHARSIVNRFYYSNIAILWIFCRPNSCKKNLSLYFTFDLSLASFLFCLCIQTAIIKGKYVYRCFCYFNSIYIISAFSVYCRNKNPHLQQTIANKTLTFFFYHLFVFTFHNTNKNEIKYQLKNYMRMFVIYFSYFGGH